MSIQSGATDYDHQNNIFLTVDGEQDRSRTVNLVSFYIGEEYNPLFLIIQEGFS